MVLFWKMAPRDGFEPPAKRLTVACSTAELPGNSAVPKRYTEQKLICKPVFEQNHSLPAKMETQLVDPALRVGITDQKPQEPWQAAQYHHHQALLREAFESQSKGAMRLIARKRDHNAFQVGCEQSRAIHLL